jgi:hypothetical protein
VRLDRGSKLAVALTRVGAGHVMFLDADDFVHTALTEFVAQRPAEQGWYVSRGIRYDARTGLCRRIDDFNRVCGTSLIFRRDSLPQVELSGAPTQAEVVEAFGEDCIRRLLGSHRHMRTEFHLGPLPMRAAVYTVNTGENDSGQGAVTVGRPLSRATAAEFGMQRTIGALSMWRSSVVTLPVGLRNHARRALGAARAG